MALHAAVESGTADSSKVQDLFTYAIGSISAAQMRYLAHWDRYVDYFDSGLGQKYYTIAKGT